MSDGYHTNRFAFLCRTSAMQPMFMAGEVPVELRTLLKFGSKL